MSTGPFSGRGMVTVFPYLYMLSPVSVMAVNMLLPWMTWVGVPSSLASSMRLMWVVALRASPPTSMAM